MPTLPRNIDSASSMEVARKTPERRTYVRGGLGVAIDRATGEGMREEGGEGEK